jgi:hypothetical protein
MGRSASAIHDAAIRAHGASLALPCGFVESVGRKHFQRGYFTGQQCPTCQEAHAMHPMEAMKAMQAMKS